MTDKDGIAIEDTKRMLMGQFSMAVVGTVNVCCKIRVVRMPAMRRISLFQRENIASLIERFAMEDCDTAPTLGHCAALETLDANERMDSRAHRHYQGLADCLLYLSIRKRQGIAYSGLQLARHMGKSVQMNLKAAKRVLRYLKGSMELAPCYTKGGSTAVSMRATVVTKGIDVLLLGV